MYQSIRNTTKRRDYKPIIIILQERVSQYQIIPIEKELTHQQERLPTS